MNEFELARDRYVSQARSFLRSLGAGEPDHLRGMRREALAQFAEVGFPGTHLEEWKYTNLSPIAKVAFEPSGDERPRVRRGEVEAIASPVFACNLFVFVNGRFEPRLSAPGAGTGELVVEPLAALRSRGDAILEEHLARSIDLKEHPFAALNTAFLDDGAAVVIPRGMDVADPIHLVFLATAEAAPTLSQPRVLLVAERSSRAVVIQDHVSLGTGTRFTNSVTEVVTRANSSLNLVLLQRESEATYHVSNLHVRQERDSRFASHTLTLRGGSLVRNDATAALVAEGAECALNGLFLGTGRQLIDNHTLVDHAVPRGTSSELYKGILGGNARGVFRGRVVVRPDAQKTDARQSNANLLLSDGAEIDTKPQLEIYADDVKCSHGSAIGRLDEEALFYLRSRGIGEAPARRLLTGGFAAEILSALPSSSLAGRAGELLVERLETAGGES